MNVSIEGPNFPHGHVKGGQTPLSSNAEDCKGCTCELVALESGWDMQTSVDETEPGRVTGVHCS